jgi:hypothetical protein
MNAVSGKGVEINDPEAIDLFGTVLVDWGCFSVFSG